MNKKKLALTDKYILKQLIETFLLGVVVFTSLVFASDQFLSLVKQISTYGIPFNVAIKTVILQLPYIIVFTIPMGILLATILTFNKLSTNSELTIMRACGISLTRLAMPVLIFSFSLAVFSFIINEFIVPTANMKAKNMMVEAMAQKNLPDGKSNFSFKELNENNQIKRLFYINNYENKKLEGVTVLDMSKPDVIQVVQSKYGTTNPSYWGFDEGVIYTISSSGKVMNTAVFNNLKLYTDLDISEMKNRHKARELNFFDLTNYIKTKSKENAPQQLSLLKVMLYEKISLPITSFLIVLIGIPLAISPPRAKVNRGLLFSIIVIFCYYITRAVSSSLGEAQIIEPFIAAWLPNIIVLSLGSFLFYRKAYLV
jgi:lipopolysaccharide export system permease protein